jgi:nicotinamide-nucleotide amidase
MVRMRILPFGWQEPAPGASGGDSGTQLRMMTARWCHMFENQTSFDVARIRKLMLEHKLSLGVAESLTSGLIQATIGAESGASKFFRGGITAYDTSQKVKHLGVDLVHAAEVNAVSARVAEEMARGVTVLFDCNYGIATTGYAEPQFDRGILAPVAHVAIWRQIADAGTLVFKDIVDGTGLRRVEMQGRVMSVCLAALRRHLEACGSTDRGTQSQS